MLFKFGIVCSLLQQFVFVLYTLDISGRNWGAFPPIHSFMQFADLTVTNQKKILTCLNWFASVCWLLLDISPLYLHCCCSVAQSCPTFCDPMDCSPPGSSVYGIFQARILEWAAISFSRGSSWPRDRTLITCIAGRFFTAEPQGKPLVPSPNLLLPHNIWTTEPSTNQHQRENTNKIVTQKNINVLALMHVHGGWLLLLRCCSTKALTFFILWRQDHLKCFLSCDQKVLTIYS